MSFYQKHVEYITSQEIFFISIALSIPLKFFPSRKDKSITKTRDIDDYFFERCFYCRDGLNAATFSTEICHSICTAATRESELSRGHLPSSLPDFFEGILNTSMSYASCLSTRLDSFCRLKSLRTKKHERYPHRESYSSYNKHTNKDSETSLAICIVVFFHRPKDEEERDWFEKFLCSWKLFSPLVLVVRQESLLFGQIPEYLAELYYEKREQ